MAYINKNKKIGSLYELLPNVSNPTLFTDAELATLGIKKYIEPVKVKTLAELKKEKLVEIKSTHQQIKTEGFMTSLGFKIDCDDKSINNFANGKQLLDISKASQTLVVDFDNVSHTVIATDYTKIVLELGGYIIKLLTEKQRARDLVNKVTTKIELANVYWRKPILAADMFTVTSWKYNSLVRF